MYLTSGARRGVALVLKVVITNNACHLDDMLVLAA